MSKASPSSSSGYRNFSSIIEEQSYTATNYASKGNLIREFMAKGGKPMPASLTIEMLGRLFDSIGNSGFYALEYSSYAKSRIKDWDYGPYGWAWCGDAFFMEGLKAVAKGGEMHWGDKIIKDPSFIGTKADCVLKQLISSGNNLFNRSSSAFTQNNSKFKLRFNSINKPTDIASARTGLPDSDGIITINFNEYLAASDKAIDLAETILHETIHAELHRIKLSNNSGPNALPIEQYKWYLKLWDFYEIRNSDQNGIASEAEHTYMSNYFINPISEALRAFDNNTHPTENYKYLAWTGLKDYGRAARIVTTQELSRLASLTSIVKNDGHSNPCD